MLAIDGTEPDGPGRFYQDMRLSDVKEIGFLGLAFRQVVPLFNFVQQLSAPAGAGNVRRRAVRDPVAGAQGLARGGAGALTLPAARAGHLG